MLDTVVWAAGSAVVGSRELWSKPSIRDTSREWWGAAASGGVHCDAAVCGASAVGRCGVAPDLLTHQFDDPPAGRLLAGDLKAAQPEVIAAI